MWAPPFFIGQPASRLLAVDTDNPPPPATSEFQLNASPGGLFAIGNAVGSVDTINSRVVVFPPVEQWTPNVTDQAAIEVAGQLLRELGTRSFYATSSCGVCGKGALEEVAVHAPPVGDGPRIARSLLAALPSVAEVEVSPRDARLTALPRAGATILPTVSELAARQGLKLKELHLESGRLDEVFRALTQAGGASRAGASAVSTEGAPA